LVRWTTLGMRENKGVMTNLKIKLTGGEPKLNNASRQWGCPKRSNPKSMYISVPGPRRGATKIWEVGVS